MNWILMKDSRVQIFARSPIENRDGKSCKVDNEFRLVVIKNEKTGKEFWFLSNEFELSAKEISEYYRKRWDIEVFFRFLKQELNLTHLVSLNKNGIEVMVYMTMIASMLLLIYKKANNLGYKTAKRRIAMELKGYDYSCINHFCRRKSRQSFQNIKEVGFLPTMTRH